MTSTATVPALQLARAPKEAEERTFPFDPKIECLLLVFIGLGFQLSFDLGYWSQYYVPPIMMYTFYPFGIGLGFYLARCNHNDPPLPDGKWNAKVLTVLSVIFLIWGAIIQCFYINEYAYQRNGSPGSLALIFDGVTYRNVIKGENAELVVQTYQEQNLAYRSQFWDLYMGMACAVIILALFLSLSQCYWGRENYVEPLGPTDATNWPLDNDYWILITNAFFSALTIIWSFILSIMSVYYLFMSIELPVINMNPWFLLCVLSAGDVLMWHPHVLPGYERTAAADEEDGGDDDDGGTKKEEIRVPTNAPPPPPPDSNLSTEDRHLAFGLPDDYLGTMILFFLGYLYCFAVGIINLAQQANFLGGQDPAIPLCNGTSVLTNYISDGRNITYTGWNQAFTFSYSWTNNTDTSASTLPVYLISTGICADVVFSAVSILVSAIHIILYGIALWKIKPIVEVSPVAPPPPPPHRHRRGSHRSL